MAALEYNDDYSFILRYFGKEAVADRFKNLCDDINDVLGCMRLIDKVNINVSALRMAMKCYYTDIARLKSFASIDKTNVAKIFGYTVYWFCRLHPINIKNFSTKEDFLNERIITYITICNLCNHMKVQTQKDFAYGKFLETCNLLLYNLKYRVYTPQTLELLFTALLDCSTMTFEEELYLCK
ncbi:MAG: hypothetical protein K2N14_01205 [Clostridia bacterium]|nr:hypothetical protein [Clostridia bacterium]